MVRDNYNCSLSYLSNVQSRTQIAARASFALLFVLAAIVLHRFLASRNLPQKQQQPPVLQYNWGRSPSGQQTAETQRAEAARVAQEQAAAAARRAAEAEAARAAQEQAEAAARRAADAEAQEQAEAAARRAADAETARLAQEQANAEAARQPAGPDQAEQPPIDQAEQPPVDQAEQPPVDQAEQPPVYQAEQQAADAEAARVAQEQAAAAARQAAETFSSSEDDTDNSDDDGFGSFAQQTDPTFGGFRPAGGQAQNSLASFLLLPEGTQAETHSASSPAASSSAATSSTSGSAEDELHSTILSEAQKLLALVEPEKRAQAIRSHSEENPQPLIQAIQERNFFGANEQIIQKLRTWGEKIASDRKNAAETTPDKNLVTSRLRKLIKQLPDNQQKELSMLIKILAMMLAEIKTTVIVAPFPNLLGSSDSDREVINLSNMLFKQLINNHEGVFRPSRS